MSGGKWFQQTSKYWRKSTDLLAGWSVTVDMMWKMFINNRKSKTPGHYRYLIWVKHPSIGANPLIYWLVDLSRLISTYRKIQLIHLPENTVDIDLDRQSTCGWYQHRPSVYLRANTVDRWSLIKYRNNVVVDLIDDSCGFFDYINLNRVFRTFFWFYLVNVLIGKVYRGNNFPISHSNKLAL